MTDRTVRVVLSATIGQFQAAMQAAAGNVQELDKQLTRVSQTDSFKKLGTGMTVAGAGITAAFGGIISQAAAFEKQMSAVKTALKPTSDELGKLQQAALDAGEQFGQFDATEAAQGITELGKAGVSTANILDGGLNGALALAASGQMDVGKAAELAASAMNQFKLKGKDIPRIADALAAGANAAQGDVSDLGMALSQSGLVANQFGLSMEETVGSLSAFASAGMMGSDAGTSLKSMLLQLATPSSVQAKKMQELGLSVYDASGEFIGLAGLADELQRTMGGLDAESRNAAMGIIFGTDAIRAANILYEQGADGIRGWTDEVSKTGSAMQTAASLTDNLAGDLDNLGGSLQTTFIKAGSGANEALRGLVQNVTKVVDAIKNIPAPVLEAGATITGALGIGLLAGGGIMKSISAITEFRENLKTLAVEAPKTAKVLGTVGKAAGVAGAVVAGLMIVGEVGKSFQKAVAPAEEFAGAVGSIAKGSNEGLQRINDSLSSLGWQQVKNLGDAFNYADQKMGSWIDNALSWTDEHMGFLNLGMASQLDQAKEAIDKVDQALASAGRSDAAAAFNKIVSDTGVSAERAAARFPKYRQALEAIANELQKQVPSFDAAKLTAQDYADWMGGKVPPAVQAAADAASAAGKDMTGLGDAMSDSAKDAQDQAAALDQLNKSLNEAANKALALSGSQMGLEAAYDDATASIAENGKTLDITTEKGRNNRQALDNIAQSALSLTKAMLDDGRSMEEVNAKTVSARAEFIRIATQMGLNAAAANKLADEYGLVPREVSTDVETPGMNMAQKGAKELRAALLNIPLERRPEIISLFNDKGYKAAMAALARVKSKTVTISTTYRTVYDTVGQPPRPGTPARAMPMYADGGIVHMFANGGAERHVAQIAPAGAWRLWAEPETGGEAYIPLAASKRARSLDILRETARIFGQRVTPLAIGDVMRPPYASQPHYAAPQPAPVVRSGATITIGTIINPVAEPATISATRELQRVAAAPTGRWV